MTFFIALCAALLFGGCEESHESHGPVAPGNRYLTVRNSTAAGILVRYQQQSDSDAFLGLTSHEKHTSIGHGESTELDVYFTDWGSSEVVVEKDGMKKTYLVGVEQQLLDIKPNDFNE